MNEKPVQQVNKNAKRIIMILGITQEIIGVPFWGPTFYALWSFIDSLIYRKFFQTLSNGAINIVWLAGMDPTAEAVKWEIRSFQYLQHWGGEPWAVVGGDFNQGIFTLACLRFVCVHRQNKSIK